MNRTSFFAALAIFSVVASTGYAQDVPVRRFDKPVWTSSEGFSSTPSIRELRDGRLIASDFKTKELWLVSATGKLIEQVAHRGAGPTEFRLPVAIIPLPGDSSLVVDRELHRFLLLGPDGKPVKTILFPQSVDGEVLTSARYADASGRVVFASASSSTADKPRAPLLRWDRSTNRIDTIADVMMQLSITIGDPLKEVRTTAIVYSPQDGWVTLADGGVAILRASDYHIDWISKAGALRSTAKIVYTPISVTAAERAAYKDMTLADRKPAFDGWLAMATPEGEIWVKRYGPANAKTVEYDVLSSAGRRIASIQLPVSRRVLAVTRSHVYISRTDDDGLVWLEAFAR